MPLYEYRCRECEARFERFVSGKGRVACPECESKRVDRLLSVFAVSSGSSRSTRSSSEPAGACGSCGDPRGPGACSMN
jgi:putative FmdB family regulatory protein